MPRSEAQAFRARRDEAASFHSSAPARRWREPVTTPRSLLGVDAVNGYGRFEPPGPPPFSAFLQVIASSHSVPTPPDRFDSRHLHCPGPRSRRSGNIKAAIPLATGGGLRVSGPPRGTRSVTLAFRVPSTVRPPSLLIALWRSGRFSHSPSTYVSSVQRTRWSSSDGTYPSQSGLPWAMTPESQIAEFVRWFRAHPSVPAAIVDRFRAPGIPGGGMTVQAVCGATGAG